MQILIHIIECLEFKALGFSIVQTPVYHEQDVPVERETGHDSIKISNFINNKLQRYFS